MRLLLFLATWVTASGAGAATFEDNFSTDPATHGWRVLGDADLFHWNETNQNLEVTWDSGRTNSFFLHPLDTIVTRRDDFQFSFDLSLSDVQVGLNPARPLTFELAIGLINVAQAIQTNFWRGVGIDAVKGPRNLVEFDYFPDSGFGATVAPTIVSHDNQFAVEFSFPLELTTDNLFHVEMNYSAETHTLTTSIHKNGESFGPIKEVTLGPSFTDFQVDSFAVTSYRDAGADGSLLAHGRVDNVVITTPPPPVQNLRGFFDHDQWQTTFLSRTNWSYALEATTDFSMWSQVSTPALGTGRDLVLSDTNGASFNTRFYRVNARRAD